MSDEQQGKYFPWNETKIDLLVDCRWSFSFHRCREWNFIINNSEAVWARDWKLCLFVAGGEWSDAEEEMINPRLEFSHSSSLLLKKENNDIVI